MVKDAGAETSVFTADNEFIHPTDESVKPESCSQKSEGDCKGVKLSKSEAEFILKARRKLRLFDPEGVYQFRGSEVRYLHSFFHITTLAISFCLILLYFAVYLDSATGIIEGLGETSDLPLIDKLFMVGIATLTLFKLKQLITVKVSHFDMRYKLALVANSFNRISLDVVRLTVYLLAVATLFIFAFYPSEKMEVAFSVIENGALADSLTLFSWVVTLIIFIRAYRRFGKE